MLVLVLGFITTLWTCLFLCSSPCCRASIVLALVCFCVHHHKHCVGTCLFLCSSPYWVGFFPFITMLCRVLVLVFVFCIHHDTVELALCITFMSRSVCPGTLSMCMLLCFTGVITTLVCRCRCTMLARWPRTTSALTRARKANPSASALAVERSSRAGIPA